MTFVRPLRDVLPATHVLIKRIGVEVNQEREWGIEGRDGFHRNKAWEYSAEAPSVQ
jgi:hypothetical protein